MRIPSPFLATTLVLLLAPLYAGCTLLGLGAAAGATVGGCALLDANDDDTITEAEFSAGLFDRWDTDGDGSLTEAEFDAGAARGDAYDDWDDDFDEWDDDDDGTLSQPEFISGAGDSGDIPDLIDEGCDNLGL
jgi:hypothetical protein